MEVIRNVIEGRKDLNRETVIIEEELRRGGQDIPPEDLELVADGIVGTGTHCHKTLEVHAGRGVRDREDWDVAEDDQSGSENSSELARIHWCQRNDCILQRNWDTKVWPGLSAQHLLPWSKLNHGSIVRMFGFCRKDNYLCLVTEYVAGGNLADCLKDKQNYPLDFTHQCDIGMAICRWLVYLHKRNVIHRDLKPANILVHSVSAVETHSMQIESWQEAKLKVCDFGISRVVKKNGVQTQDDTLGSPQYAAPGTEREKKNSMTHLFLELVNPDHDNKVDVFSFAIM